MRTRGLKLISTLFALLVSGVASAQLNVAPGGSNSGNCQPGPCQTITYALTQAPSGATINIAAGTYNEALRVTQSVSLIGAAAATTIIAPTLANQRPAPAPTNSGSVIIDINGAGINVVVRNLTVRFPSNNYPPAGTSPIRGIWVTGGANARIENNIVTEIHDFDITGAQTGDCIRAGDPTRGGSGTFEVLNNTISRCQKTGITANQTGTVATITGNTISEGGTGERNGLPNRPLGQTNLASNGIQMAFGARGLISNNTVRDAQCNLPAPNCGGNIDVDIATATGILVLGQGTGTVVSNNTISASDDGISVGPNLFTGGGAATPLTVTGNTLTNNRFRGVTVFSGTTTFRGNTVTGGTTGLLAANYGETVQAIALLNDPTPTIAGQNIIRNASANGIWVRTFAPAPLAAFGGPPVSPSVDGTLARTPIRPDGPLSPIVQGSTNQFVGNALGANNNPDQGTANLTCNWWGSAAGPGANGANAASANVTRTPWAINNVDFACPPGGPTGAFTITKNGPATAIAGQSITYTVSVINNGPADASGSVFSDPVPASIGAVTWTCAASNGAVCPNAAGTGNAISQTIAVFPPLGRLDYTISGIIALGTTQIINTATITPPTGIGASASSSAVTTTVTSLVIPVDTLSLTGLWLLVLLSLVVGAYALRRK
jgi:uncharacterized repeat protein (TIGR01451 family)